MVELLLKVAGHDEPDHVFEVAGAVQIRTVVVILPEVNDALFIEGRLDPNGHVIDAFLREGRVIELPWRHVFFLVFALGEFFDNNRAIVVALDVDAVEVLPLPSSVLVKVGPEVGIAVSIDVQVAVDCPR